MITVTPGTKVYLCCRPTDMRRGFDGLAADVAAVLRQVRIPAICSSSGPGKRIT
ncbi:IS66 family insertion sequence element accessory protein TnpB [Mycobacterium sp. KBS0706]|uniref:IS66 family insertion sequence element accessory protein TnpB n=1 Tax=Mycobacterium sp. KBS0706 TaxID=2578109 RepID=UPI0027D3481E|nr:IS66 family insertion sequence element accessory protein TnpB [Mycobacterium sp. KBS0706]